MLAINWSSIEWGTAGEWMSSLAVLVAIAGLVVEHRQRKEAERRRVEEEERRVASRLHIWPGRRMADNDGNWFQEVQVRNSSDETIWTLYAEAQFGEDIEPIGGQLIGPLRPNSGDTVNVPIPDEIAEQLAVSPLDASWTESGHRVHADDKTLYDLGRHALVSALFEDHEGRLWRKHQGTRLERIRRPNDEKKAASRWRRWRRRA